MRMRVVQIIHAVTATGSSSFWQEYKHEHSCTFLPNQLRAAIIKRMTMKGYGLHAC